MCTVWGGMGEEGSREEGEGLNCTCMYIQRKK